MSSLPPVPSLPTPKLTEIGPGTSLLEPLSRKGSGPGLIVLSPTLPRDDFPLIQDGIPSVLMKWAEESYAVVEIRGSALHKPTQSLTLALNALSQCNKCEPKGSVGLVAYDGAAWNQFAEVLPSFEQIVATVIYADACSAPQIVPSPVPCVQHLAGASKTKLPRSLELTAYDYPTASAFLFATPFQACFNYSLESVSHTRNLTFLKRVMKGPYFDLEAIWEEHTYYEFENRSVDHTMATMVQEPYVNHIPTMTGGIGRKDLTEFYANHFIFKNSKDTELELISRTVGTDRVVDEFIYKCTHDSEIDWLVPGIPPTNKKLEIPFTAFVNIRGDRLYHEHISWDQASLLIQLDLLPEYLPFTSHLQNGNGSGPKKLEYRIPAAGVETAQKMRDKNSVPSNGMFEYKVRATDV